MYCLFCLPVTFSVNDNSISIEVLTGLNFKKWKEDFLFGMELADVHIALSKDKPTDITATSTETEKTDYAAWEKSNRICLLTMKKSIQEHLKSGLPADCTAKEMMEALEARNRTSSNAEVGTLLQKLFNMKYDGSAGVRDYVLRMVNLQTKLQALNVSIPDACIVHQALNTLPPDFGIIKTNYNSQDETWSVNDLIVRVVAEEEKLKKEKGHLALYVSSSHKRKNKKSRNRTHKGTHDTTGQSDNMGPKKTSFKRDGDRCFFYKKKGHIKKDCANFKAWLFKRESTGNDSLELVFESNLSEAPSSSWWLDSGATNHVAFTIQGFINRRKPNQDESKLTVGNNEKADVMFVGDEILILDSGFRRHFLCTFI